MLEEVVRLGEATGMEDHAHELRGELEGRLATVRAAVAGVGSPRVIALQRLDPPRVGGFWIPEMISIAGGEDVAGDPGLNPPDGRLGRAGQPPRRRRRGDARGLDRGRAGAGDGALGADRRPRRDPALRGRRRPLFADPGPRLVDGVELLGHVLHPDLVDPPGNIGFASPCAARRSLRRPRARRPLRAPRRRPSPRSPAAAGCGRTSLSRRRRSPGRRSTPPIRPPRWPPTLMFGPRRS